MWELCFSLIYSPMVWQSVRLKKTRDTQRPISGWIKLCLVLSNLSWSQRQMNGSRMCRVPLCNKDVKSLQQKSKDAK